MYIGKELKYDPVNGTTCTNGDNCYTWNVVKKNTSSVDIMMNENLGTSAWNDDIVCIKEEGETSCTDKDPGTLLSALASATSSWKHTARILYAEEVASIIGKTELDVYYGKDTASNCNKVNCSIDMNEYGWLLGTASQSGSSDEEDVYWLLSDIATAENHAYEIRYGLSWSSIHDSNYIHGFRPVITVPLNQLQ